MKSKQDLNKEIILKSITEHYDNVREFAVEHDGVRAKFHVVDFWEKWDGSFRKEGEGNFYEFAIALFSCASERASDTIKLYFDHRDYKIDYDLNNTTHALYILAKGEFNGQEYFVKATSEYKYDKENYVFNKTSHREE